MTKVSLQWALIVVCFWGCLAHNQASLRGQGNEPENRLSHKHTGSRGGGRCGTKEVDRRDIEAQERGSAFARFRRARKGFRQQSSEETRIIPVCFHNGRWLNPLKNIFSHVVLSDQQLQNELDHLNQAFSRNSCCDSELPWCDGECSVDVNIQFAMARLDESGNVIGTTNSTSDPDACVTRPKGFCYLIMAGFGDFIRSRLRKGDQSVLNVYFIRPSLTPPGGNPVLGYATFPWRYLAEPQRDGIVVEPTTVSGGIMENYNEGDTLVHEVRFVYW